MKAVIMDAKNQSDSVGGVVESAIMSMPAGIGSPLFQSVESYLSSLLFSVPAVKGVEFGSGFELTQMMGSEANDSYHIVGNKVKTSTNHNGGITGGITNGMPVIVRCAIKPTSSIGKPQNTVNIKDFKNTVLSVQGRHDPAIVHRIVFVINAALNYAVLDLMSSEYGLDWMR
jgi:chorismate synthase